MTRACPAYSGDAASHKAVKISSSCKLLARLQHVTLFDSDVFSSRSPYNSEWRSCEEPPASLSRQKLQDVH